MIDTGCLRIAWVKLKRRASAIILADYCLRGIRPNVVAIFRPKLNRDVSSAFRLAINESEMKGWKRAGEWVAKLG